MSDITPQVGIGRARVRSHAGLQNQHSSQDCGPLQRCPRRSDVAAGRGLAGPQRISRCGNWIAVLFGSHAVARINAVQPASALHAGHSRAGGFILLAGARPNAEAVGPRIGAVASGGGTAEPDDVIAQTPRGALNK